MNDRIYVLDSTLRDGGYCNNWRFGQENIKRIISGLIDSNVDVIECGMLSEGFYSADESKYSSIHDATEILPKKKDNKLFVLLMNYGDYDIDKLPEYENGGINGIRLAFHKKDMVQALEAAKKIKGKKYKVFIQPMVTATYSVDEYVDLLKSANEINPYAFYIVDSFGSMSTNEVRKYCSLATHILKSNIILGFHSHNNLQLAFSNSQAFVEESKGRKIIVDSCIMGMGRGAGNLNTELFLDFMNSMQEGEYKVTPLLVIIDEILNLFYEKKYWGYSLPNYLSATYNMHPNYATYLADKNTLTISMMGELLSLVDISKKNSFNKHYIEDLYVSYMCAKRMKDNSQNELSNIFGQKDVLIIAPGKSIDTEIEKVQSFLNSNDVITICVNFDLAIINADYIFVSNPKRYEELGEVETKRLITTSNIDVKEECIKVDYLSLLSEEMYVRDNAVMMLMKLLINSGARKIYLAGVDGYEKDSANNYSKYSAALVTSDECLEYMNQGMNRLLHKYLEEIDVQFITSERMIRR
jgi:4-hydroxy 2-oxovalerate aldolase